MLEIRYNKTTKELTGWWGDRHGNYEVKLKNRPDEAMVLLDIPIPDKLPSKINSIGQGDTILLFDGA